MNRSVLLLVGLTTIVGCRSPAPESARVEPSASDAGESSASGDAGPSRQPIDGDAGLHGRDASLATESSAGAPRPPRCSPGAPSDAGRPTFHSFARNASTGHSDRVGFRGLAPDGHKDVVLDVDFEGAAFGFILKSGAASTEGSTAPAWDSLVGAPAMPVLKHVSDVFVFKNDEPLNGASEPVVLAPGRHKLIIRLSGPFITAQTPWRIYAVLPDCSLIEGPMLR